LNTQSRGKPSQADTTTRTASKPESFRYSVLSSKKAVERRSSDETRKAARRLSVYNDFEATRTAYATAATFYLGFAAAVPSLRQAAVKGGLTRR
jgi:hypothetical protein